VISTKGSQRVQVYPADDGSVGAAMKCGVVTFLVISSHERLAVGGKTKEDTVPPAVLVHQDAAVIQVAAQDIDASLAFPDVDENRAVLVRGEDCTMCHGAGSMLGDEGAAGVINDQDPVLSAAEHLIRAEHPQLTAVVGEGTGDVTAMLAAVLCMDWNPSGNRAMPVNPHEFAAVGISGTKVAGVRRYRLNRGGKCDGIYG
jgi:hypothetical protein